MDKGAGTLIGDITFAVLSGFTTHHLQCMSFGQDIKMHATKASVSKILSGQMQGIHR